MQRPDVRSTTAALAAFVFTDSMPSQVDVETRTSSGPLATIATACGTIER